MFIPSKVGKRNVEIVVTIFGQQEKKMLSSERCYSRGV